MKPMIEKPQAVPEIQNPFRASYEKALDKYDTLMYVEEVSKVLRISKKMMCKLLKTSALNSISIGRRKLIAKEWVIEYLCQQTAIE